MNYIDPIARKRAIIEDARRKAAPKAEEGAIQRTVSFVDPKDAPNRNRIVFDNSGSMADYILDKDKKKSTKMKEALKGVIEFLRNSSPDRDAVAIHMLNAYVDRHAGYSEKTVTISSVIHDSILCTDLIRLASAVDNPELTPTGGTPLYARIEKSLEAEPKATRLIAFSDGQAGDEHKKGVAISLATRLKIKIDTVFFGQVFSSGASEMKELAEATGGIFLAFDPAKGVNFATAFKYLTEGNRRLLADKSFVEKLERGEVK